MSGPRLVRSCPLAYASTLRKNRRRRIALGALAAGATLVVAATAGCASPESAPGEEADEPSAATTSPAATPAKKAKKKGKKKAKGATVQVTRVIDGDTIDVSNGRRVRLVQIDAPEASGECYGAESTAVLSSLLPVGTRVRLERDPALDDVDRYDRVLRYVFAGGKNVNLLLVRRGAASVWFYDGDRGRYADRLLAAAQKARRQDRGAWGACRATLDPTGAFETSPRVAALAAPAPAGGDCMAGYSPCLPITGDLDCADVRRLGKAPVRVTGGDPYRLDGDDDGWGCE